MMKHALIGWLASCILLTADDDSFREQFADPATRSAALAELIPGTREAWFYTALDHQLAGRNDAFRKTIDEWRAASERRQQAVSASGLAVLENRQLLLDHARDPEASISKLIERLELEFNHARPDADAAARSLPTRLDPALVSEAKFEQAAARKSPRQAYTTYRGRRLLRELDQVGSFDDDKLRWFLENLHRADLPGVVPLVERVLKLEIRGLSFTQHRLLRQLTSQQLQALLAARPELRSMASFNLAHLAKLRPGSETVFTHDLQAHAAYLQRCRDHALSLPPAQGSLLAHVLFHHLRLQRELGNFPKQDFISFLKLPRQRHALLRTPQRPDPNCIRIDADFAAATGCPPVRDDLELIRGYLQHFLSRSDSAADFAPFIEQAALEQMHAQARLLAGENPQRWGKLLDPADFKQLQQEVRIDFAPGAPRQLAADAAVSLALDLKNTPKLLLRIYEIDLPSHLAGHRSWPDADIDLEGLVPHHERQLSYPQPAMVLHRESIPLPELAGPGSWLVEFVSGQASARALIRKGGLTTHRERSASGQTVRVFDETGTPVAGARLSLGHEHFSADASGRITIPDAPNQPLTRGIVEAGKLATHVQLEDRSNELALDTRFFLEREQLLADQDASLKLRLRLTNHGHELPLERIQNPALVLKAELLGGITTERVIAENLKLAPTLEIPFQVPADLLQLTLTLRGSVETTTGGKPVKLEGQASYQINGQLKTANIGGAFFSPTASGHRLEVRGRNGEPLAERTITLKCRRDGYQVELKTAVRTDAHGRVDLGNLEGIESLTAIGSEIGSARYDVPRRRLHPSAELMVARGEEIRLPLVRPAEAPDRLDLSLLETLEGQPLRDHFDKLAIVNGQLVIRQLPAGDFVLSQGDEETAIRVSSGRESHGLLVSSGRILPRHSPANPTIVSAAARDGQLQVQLRDCGPDTRLSVVGKRYLHHGWNEGGGLHPFAPPLADSLSTGFVPCDFLADRRLSDEMRYILDRRSAKRFPGSMLPRPGLLLNRWTEQDLEQEEFEAFGGANGRSGFSTVPSAMRRSRSGGTRGLDVDSALSISCDFLAMPAAVKFNLTPQADGSVNLPMTAFSGCQFLEITVADAFADEARILPLPADEPPLRDRRIARPLDPQAHHLATRRAAVLKKGATASIQNLLDADWRAFTTLSEAHQFLYGSLLDERLRKFVFLTEWPSFNEAEKLALLADHACHEFHLFLARKDKPFFNTHVRPMLAQKPEPQFIDDLLLGRDLQSHLRPYAWQRLNAAEKALLAQALPQARQRIARELTQRWELEAPGPQAETMLFTRTLRGTDLAQLDSLGLASNALEARHSGANAYLGEKLRRIVIPHLDFENTTVEEALAFLHQRSRELDTLELDPAKKGVNLVLRQPSGLDLGLGGPLVIDELRARNVPLEVALRYICDKTKLRYKVSGDAIALTPQTETGEDLFTRSFTVPPDFASSLANTGSGGESDPFSPAGGVGGESAQALPPVSELLKQAGIAFPEGSQVTLNGNVLIVMNTPTELDKVESLTMCLASSPPTPGMLPQAGGFGGDPGGSALLESLESSDAFDAFAPDEGANALDSPARPRHLPRFAEVTRQWFESNYYEHRGAGDESLIPLNRFWIDLAAWDGAGDFLSPHFNTCTSSANEALMCLAMLDLPFTAERPEVAIEGSTLRVKAREPMLLFYKDTRRSDQLAQGSPLLLRQSFCPLREQFRTVNGQRAENQVTGDFYPGVPYSATLTVTNPTGIGRRVDLLAQIPAGSIPLQGNPATLSSTVEIEPHGVVIRELVFYFPAAGDHPVYPLHLSEDGKVLAHTEPRILTVSNDPARPDANSWRTIAREGRPEDVLERLREENLATLDLTAICWRLKDRGFFQQVSAILRERLHFSADVAAYGFHHRDPQVIRTYLENSTAIHQLGRWLDSPLLDVRPRVHHDWQTVEFDPLVNPRAHRFGENPRLAQPQARAHYHALLEQLSWKPALDAGDQLSLTAYLLLQDRIEEALARFPKIQPQQLPGRLHYDYLHAVVLFYQEKPGEAKKVAVARLPQVPAGIWRERFQAVIHQADEIAGLATPDALSEPVKAPAEPQLDIRLGSGGQLVLTHRGLKQARLKLFSVDLEILFSKDPFLKGEGGNAYLSLRPNKTFEVPLTGDAGETTVALPKPLDQGNLLVAAESGATQLLKVLDSHALELRHSPLQRTLQVLDATSHKPLVKAYVKVYAEHHDGSILFHKDGYTDLRGKFDYLSHTGIDPAQIQRVALLVSHPQKGARSVIYKR